MAKHYCADCGTLLGDDVDGYSCLTSKKDGRELCMDCGFKETDREMKKLEAERNNNGKDFQKKHVEFAEAPLGVIQYCGQENLQVSSDAMMNSQTIKIKIDDLHEYHTACGAKGNKPFDAKVMSFLKEHSPSDFVVAEVYDKEIQNLSVKWNQENQKTASKKFADMVSRNGGSLRPELIFEQGWDCYESE